MENTMKKIDLANWERTLHYQIFRNYAQPQYCVTFDLDVTHFLDVIKKRGYSFTFSFVFAVSKCANQIKEFRCRFVDGEPVIFDKIHTAFTYLNKDTELFKVVNVEMTDTLEEYVTLASETEQAQKDYFTAPLGNDVFQFSAFHGSHIPIFPTQIPEIKITQHHYLTGADMKKGMEKSCFPFLSKFIILS